jgi:replicative superfamily II helicase
LAKNEAMAGRAGRPSLFSSSTGVIKK